MRQNGPGICRSCLSYILVLSGVFCLDKCVRMVLVFVGVVYLIFLFYRALILPRCSQANDKVFKLCKFKSSAESKLHLAQSVGFVFKKERNLYMGTPFPKRQILDSSKQKEFADDNFRFNKNGGKFSKKVENTVGKGEIARYEQFLLFPQCFQKTCTADT